MGFGDLMTRLLTPSGYRDIADCQVGDPVCAFDMESGAPIVNTIESISPVDGVEWARWHEKASLPPFTFYRINGIWTLNSEQSIWRNGTNVCHGKHLVVGDVVYDDADQPVTITSIEEITEGPETFIRITDLRGASFLFFPAQEVQTSEGPIAAQDIAPDQYFLIEENVYKVALTRPVKGWVRFDISGDHSYIVDGMTLHNASRFCKPGAGSADWTPSNTGIWAATSGGATGSSVPGAADAVTCDGNFGGGTCVVNFGGLITIQSITCGAMTGTLDNSVNNNDFTLSASTGFNGSGSGTRAINLGNGIYNLTTTGGGTPWSMGSTTGLTFNANSSTINLSGATTSAATASFSGGGLTYNIVILGATAGGTKAITGANTFTTLTITGINYVTFAANQTIGTLNVNGTSSNQVGLASSAIVNQRTLTVTTLSATWAAIRDMAFSGSGLAATNSFDLGNNSGITITAPSASSGGGPLVGGRLAA